MAKTANQAVSPAEIARLQEVETTAKKIIMPMMSGADGGAMWVAFSMGDAENMSEQQALELIRKFEKLVGYEKKPKKKA